MNRRELLRAGVAVAGCCCAGAGLGCAALSGTSKTPTPPEGALRVEGDVALLDLDKTPSLTGPEASVKFVVEGVEPEPIKVLVIRLDDRYEAFVNTCTHGGREIDFLPKSGHLRCASVGHSEFDSAGKTLSGPAQDDLTVLGVQRRGHTLAITVA